MVHLIVPGGDCREATPRKRDLSTLAMTLRSLGLCCKVVTQPLVDTVPLPVNVVPPQQKR